MEEKKSIWITQVIPLSLTVVIFGIFSGLLYLQVLLLNRFTITDIVGGIRISDIIIGMTIYLKTSVDFAIFIGNMMAQFPGWKNRIAIETGTAAGNALGTLVILAIWNFFREVKWLLAIMIFIAAIVLLRLAEDGLEHARSGTNLPVWFYPVVDYFEKLLFFINRFTRKFFGFIIPNLSTKSQDSRLSFWGLLLFSFTIPFILGLDDFAGYIPLFNIVNVLGFGVGILAGHMVLNIFLFLSPSKTISVVRNPLIAFFGSVAFVILAFWGFFEVYKILFIH